MQYNQRNRMNGILVFRDNFHPLCTNSLKLVLKVYLFPLPAQVEFFTANFAFCVALGRLLHFFFWLSSYHELNNKYAAHFGAKYPGHFVVISQVCAKLNVP